MVRLRQVQLPLKDLFCNQEIEFDVSLEETKILFPALKQTNSNFNHYLS